MKSSGQRRHIVTLQEEVETEDAIGGRSKTWSTYATVRAAIENKPVVVSEGQATVAYELTILYRSDTMDKHLAGIQQRANTATKRLKILEMVTPMEMKRELVMTCARVTD